MVSGRHRPSRARPRPRPRSRSRPPPPPGVADAAYLVVNQEFIVVGGEPGDTEVFVINAGEKVTWTQGDNDGTHNVEFKSEQPNSCVQPEGFPQDTNTTAPVPDFPIGGAWKAECRFMTAGTYSFVCNAHQETMTGKVIVTGTATPTPTPTVTTTPTPTPTVTVTPTPTPPSGPAIVAKDGGAEPYWFQDASSTDPTDNSVTIQSGGTVNFSYPVGVTVHNVVFSGTPTQPTCVLTSGQTAGLPIPPLPPYVQPPGWRRQLHVRHRRHLLVRVLGAPDDDRHRRRPIDDRA